MRTDAGRVSPAGIIAVVGVVAILSGLVFTHLLAAPTSQFPTGTAAGDGSGGAVYTAPDGSFTVRLPQAPVTSVRTISVVNGTATIASDIVATPGSVIDVSHTVLSTQWDPSLDNVVLQGALTGAAGTGGQVDNEIQTTWASRPAVEADLTLADGQTGHVLVVDSGSSVITLKVRAVTGADQLYQRIKPSLTIR